jgi:hypothetical protein
MAIIEQNMFNTHTFEAFTPKVTQESNSNIITVLVVLGLTVAVGVIIYKEIKKQTTEKNRFPSNGFPV